MPRPYNARNLFVVSLVNLFVVGSFSLPVHAQNQSIFSGLPYEENFIRAKMAEFTVTADTPVGAVAIPTHLSYQLALRKILADENLQAHIDANDLQQIKNLPAPWDHSFLARDQKEITAICVQTNSIQTAADIQDLATRYDNSRKRKEHDLDVFYDNALAGLAAETRELIEDVVLNSSASQKIAYTTFDMTKFALVVPEAAKALLINGCDNFSAQIIAYTPQTVKLGDL